MARPRQREENSTCKLGQAMQAKKTRRSRPETSRNNEQSTQRQNLVEVVETPQGALGQTMEEEIHPGPARESPHSLEWG